MEYKVRVVETLSRLVTLEANSEQEAIDAVESLYNKSKIVLDDNDYDGVEYKIEK